MLQSDSGISFSERRAAFAFQFRYVHGFRSVTLEAIRYKSYKRLFAISKVPLPGEG